MYLRIQDNKLLYPYQLVDFFIENPQLSLSKVDLEEQLNTYGIFTVFEVVKPNYNLYTQKVVETDPQCINNKWTQSYTIVELSSEEQQVAKTQLCPVVVSMRQAKLALLQAGLLDEVDAAIKQSPRALQIEWEYATEVNRDWPTLTVVKDLLQLTEDKLDDLFILASTL